MTAALVLTGLRVPSEVAHQLFAGVRNMEESSTFVAIMEKGAVREARKMILRLGTNKFGLPDQATQVIIGGITELGHLEDLLQRLMEVNSWSELLASS